MKKIILKYLPIAIALLLVGACFLTLSIYKGSFAEYAVFSYSSNTYSFDMNVSSSGKIISLEAQNRKSYEIKESVKKVMGMDIADAAAFLYQTLNDEIVMVTVTGAEKNELPSERLSELAYRASDSISGNHIVAYGNYNETDMNRVNTFEVSLGRIAVATDFAEYCTQNVENCYVDSYSVSPADLESLAYYVNYMRDDILPEELRGGILIDTSHVVFKSSYISVDDAKDIVYAESESWYGDHVSDFEYKGITFNSGKLKYKFTTFYYGYESYVYVGMVDGDVFFEDEG
jgi:hypothetical protein